MVKFIDYNYYNKRRNKLLIILLVVIITGILSIILTRTELEKAITGFLSRF